MLPLQMPLLEKRKKPGEQRAEGISEPGQSPLSPRVIFPQGFIPSSSRPEQQLCVAGAGWQQGQGTSVGTCLQATRAGAQHTLQSLPDTGHPLLHPLGRAPSAGQGCSLQHIFQGLAGAETNPKEELQSPQPCSMLSGCLTQPSPSRAVTHITHGQGVICRSTPLPLARSKPRAPEIRDTAVAACRFPALHPEPRALPVLPLHLFCSLQGLKNSPPCAVPSRAAQGMGNTFCTARLLKQVDFSGSFPAAPHPPTVAVKVPWLSWLHGSRCLVQSSPCWVRPGQRGIPAWNPLREGRDKAGWG